MTMPFTPPGRHRPECWSPSSTTIRQKPSDGKMFSIYFELTLPAQRRTPKP
jgi:hypothetical protein